MLTFIPDFLTGALSIILVDLVLSGDNAVVIGMAARRLPSRQRYLAILLGGFGAIVLRILLATGASFLLAIPLLEAIGGALLLWIAWKLLPDEQNSHDVLPSASVFGALQTIVVADLVMSPDNVLAIAGVSHGNVQLLVFGLVLSMPLVLSSSGLIAALIGRLPWLLPVGASVLAWTGGGMIVDDHVLGPLALATAIVAPSIPLIVRAFTKTCSRVRSTIEAL